MIHASVIPDRQIVGIRPPVPNLQVMILNDQVFEPFEQVTALGWCETVNTLAVRADRKDGLPACDGIGTHDGMLGGKLGTNVVRGAAWTFEEGETIGRRGFTEARLGVGGGQRVEELLVGGGYAVVELIARSPESVCLGLVSSKLL